MKMAEVAHAGAFPDFAGYLHNDRNAYILKPFGAFQWLCEAVERVPVLIGDD